MEPELVADTAVAVGGTRVATETGSASVADTTPAASGACGRIDMLDPLVLGLAARWSSDPGSSEPVPATDGLKDPC